MTLMITTASSGAPAGPAGTPESTGSDGPAGDAFAGVLANIPESEGRPSGRTPAPERTSAADRTGEQAGEPAAELAAMAGMALLLPPVPATIVLALRADTAVAATAVAGTAVVNKAVEGTAVAATAVARTAVVNTAVEGTAVAATAVEGTAVSKDVGAPAEMAGTAVASALPSSPVQQPAAVTSQVPDSEISPVPKPSGAADLSMPAVAPRDERGRTDRPGNSDGAGSERPTGAGHGLGPVKAMGPANAADAAQVAAAARIFRNASTPETPAPTGGSSSPEAADLLLPASGAEPDAGKLAGSANLPAGGKLPSSANLPVSVDLPRTAGAATVSSHRPAKLSTGAGETRSAEPVQPTGQFPAGVPKEPAPAAAQPALTAVQQAPPQPSLAGHHIVGGHRADRASFQPASTAETPLARQVAAPLLALRAGGDGSHQLIVALHPAELGPVNVHVRIEGDLMTIQLASNNETAHDTLRDALPQLRSELQSAGLGGVALSLDLASGGAPGSGAFADPRQAGGDPSRPARAAPVSELTPAPPRHRTSGDRIGTHSSSGLDRWL